MSNPNAFVAPALLARQDRTPVESVCYCCGATYTRGNFKCCAARGMASHHWLASYCVKCKKCPNHCVCVVRVPYAPPPQAERGLTPVATVAKVIDFKNRAAGEEG